MQQQQTVQRRQTICPDAPNFIMGDFNHCLRTKSLNHFLQYVTCPPRQGKVLNQCDGTISGAYKSYVMAPLGLSDHSNVHLVPTYQSTLTRGNIKLRVVLVWTEDSTLELKDCFECTEWDLLKDSCSDLDDLTDTVSSYISFCENMLIPCETYYFPQ